MQRTQLVRGISMRALGGARRGLCAPATVSPIVTEIREAIVDLKAKLDAKPDAGAAYSPDAFSSALKAGSVDVSLLSSTLGDFDVAARKLALKCVADSTAMAKAKAEEEATMEGYDWSQWEKKGLDAETIAEVKAIMTAGVSAEAAKLPELMKASGLDTMEKEVTDAFKGPGGFLELAAGQEKAAQETLIKCIADLEKLEVDASGLRDVTIAEILEREPEVRAEIEEEISNNNWGY